MHPAFSHALKSLKVFMKYEIVNDCSHHYPKKSSPFNLFDHSLLKERPPPLSHERLCTFYICAASAVRNDY